MTVFESMSQTERVLRARSAGLKSWANTADRSARTRNGTQAFLDRFEQQVDPDGVLPPAERALRAEALKKSYMADLSRRGVKAKRAKKQPRSRQSSAATPSPRSGRLAADPSTSTSHQDGE